MVRILLAKIQDESNTSPDKYPKFWITAKQYASEDGRKQVAKEIRALFREYADSYPNVFDAHEDISVGDSTLIETASVLQRYTFISRGDDADEWDLMGAAYEQFTHSVLKRQQGQFFTNRLVVRAMVHMLNPSITDAVLDPTGGSGGFATEAFRHKRRKVIENTIEGTAQRERQLERPKTRSFWSRFLSVLPKSPKRPCCSAVTAIAE